MPSDAAWQQLISTLHASGRKAALAITGAAVGRSASCFVSRGLWLLIERRSLRRNGACGVSRLCAGTGVRLRHRNRDGANRSGTRSRAGAGGRRLVGLGATAALVSDRPRKGEHRFHIAFANSAGIAHCTCVMAKGRRDRAAEETCFARDRPVAQPAHWIATPSPHSLLDADEHYAETVVAPGAAVDTIDQLLAGELDRVTVQPDGQVMLSAPQPLCAVPRFVQPDARGHVLLAGRRRA
jgi:hypothetical protein